MREPPDIGEERLRACLQDQYDLIPVVLEFLSLGHDYNAGVYHVVSVQNRAYLLKATSRLLYEPSCLVPAYLRDYGCDLARKAGRDAPVANLPLRHLSRRLACKKSNS